MQFFHLNLNGSSPALHETFLYRPLVLKAPVAKCIYLDYGLG